MANPVFTLTIKQGAIEPRLLLQLLGDDGEPVDLTGATAATLYLTHHTTRAVTSKAMTFYDRDDGQIEWLPLTADTATAAYYEAVAKVTLASGRVGKWPADGWGAVDVQAHSEV